jgi:hypothetical protein
VNIEVSIIFKTSILHHINICSLYWLLLLHKYSEHHQIIEKLGIYRISQGERSVFWVAIVSVIPSKETYMYLSYFKQLSSYNYLTVQMKNLPFPQMSFKGNSCIFETVQNKRHVHTHFLLRMADTMTSQNTSKVVSVLNWLNTSWRWVVSFTPRSLYPWGKSPRFPFDRLGGPQSRSGWHWEEKVLDPTGTWTL